MRLSERLGLNVKETPFENRPLCFLSAVFLGALFLIQTSLAAFLLYGAAVICFAVYSAYSVFKADGRSPLTSPTPYLVLGALTLAMVLPIPDKIEMIKMSEIAGEHQIKCVVKEIMYQELFGALAIAETVEIDGVAFGGYVQLIFDYDPVISEWDTLYLQCEIGSAMDGVSGSELLRLKSADIRLTCENIRLVKVTAEAKKGIPYAVFCVREAISQRLYTLLDAQTAAYSGAILIGEKSGLESAFVTDMSALGISHILAVSGMHTSILAATVTFIADRFKASRKMKCLILILFGIAFSALAGFSPSVVRAVIMMSLGLCAVFFGARSDPLTSLTLAGVIICVIEPRNAISCSFLLSFCATLGITFCGLYAEKAAAVRLRASRVGDMRLLYKAVRAVLASLIVTVCAVLFTAPVMAAVFGELSFFAVVMNAFAVPMAFVSMLLTLSVLFFGNIPIAGEMLCDLYNGLFSGFEALTDSVSSSFETSVSLLYPFFMPCLALCASLLVFLWIARIRSVSAVIATVVSTAVIFTGCAQLYRIANADKNEIVYLTDGNSEAFVISSGDVSAVVDVGNGSYKMPSKGAQSAKRDFYETSVDAFVLTHYHVDHIGAVKRLERTERIKRLIIPLPETEKEEQIYNVILAFAGNMEVQTYKRGEEITLGKATLTTLPRSTVERSMHPVIALKIQTLTSAITFIGGSVSESDGLIEAERMLSSSSAVIIGTHGPVRKEEEKLLFIAEEAKVYISPYAESVGVRGNGIDTDAQGFAQLRVRLS